MGDFWQQTASLYGSLFEKPKMSQKLLEKPPFKYLFDIIIETQKTTGFCKQLYSAEELDPAFYDSKERKLAYLQKIIQVTQLMLNEQIIAKPSKIVAGLEPENTNLMLQQIYKAATSGKNSDAAVKRVLAANGADIPPEKAAPQQAPPQKQKVPEQAAPQQQPPPTQQKQEPKSKPKEIPVEPQQPPPQQEIKKKKVEEPPPPPQKQQQQPVTTVNQPPPQQYQQSQNEARPSTAKRRPPKLTQTQVEEHGAKKVQGPTNVIKDNNDDNFEDMIQTEQNKPVAPQQNTNLASQQHGKFIRGAAQQVEKAAAEEVAQEGEKNDGESKIKLGRLGGKKKADAVKAQVSQNLGTSQVSDTVVLQTLVQQICQSANPLGKSLEFISDDLESMNHELTNWRKVYEKSKTKMQEMSKATEETQQPLFDKIAEVEESIREKKNKISNLKAQIIKNKFTIDSLLKSVVVQK